MTPKKVRDEWRKSFVQDAAVTERLCDDVDALEVELAQKLDSLREMAATCGRQEARLNYILRVLRLINRFECDDILWRVDGDEVTFLVNSSDVFVWGGADCEEVTPENVGELERAYADVRAAMPKSYSIEADAQLLFCCRVRKMRPQGCCYPAKELWPLIDACGPEREVGIGNPYPPGGGRKEPRPSYAQQEARIAELERERDERPSVKEWERLIEQRDTARLDLKTHMHLVRTMGERCGLLGWLLWEWLNKAIHPAGDLATRTERALAQGEGRE